MSDSHLIDSHGRVIGSVRISIVDRCNMRCKYCMPEEGIQWVDKKEILSFEEINRLVGIFYRYNIRKFRLTGGEPLVRKGIVNLIKMLRNNFPDIELSITTNGTRLKLLSKDLYNAGVNRLNISLDTLDADEFNKMTRRNYYDEVMEGIYEALKYDFDNIKVNAVSIKSFNDDWTSLKQFIDFSEKTGIEVRFIELMPFSGNNWEDHGFISSQELRDRISRHEKLVKLPVKNKNSTSKTWSLREGDAKLGFISSVSESFCDKCNRIRITAEGKLRPCLHNSKEYDLKNYLRNQKSDEEIVEAIKNGIQEKWKKHPDFLALSYSPPVDDREMIKIGG